MNRVSSPKADRTAMLGMLLFIAAEAMFFAGLLSSFLVFRVGQAAWPPAGQPRLPAAATALYTAFLLGSAVTLQLCMAAARRGSARTSRVLLATTALLGAAFLLGQGREWVALLAFGLKWTTSVYGALFYVLVGAHGLHVVGALAAGAWVLARHLKGRYAFDNLLGLRLFRAYWFFVVGVWPLLYALLYLS